MKSKNSYKKKGALCEFEESAKICDYENISEALNNASEGGRRNSSGPEAGPQKRFERTHAAILKSAAGLFAYKGFKGATTRDIAAGAGVTEITLYRHFKSKEEIFIEIIKNMSLLSMADDLSDAGANLDIKSKLEHIALKFITLFQSRSNEFRIMLSETITRPDMSQMFFETIPSRGIEMISKIMQKEIERGVFKKADPKLLARAFIGMFLAYNLMQEIFLGKERDPQDPNEITRIFTEIFLNGALKK